MLAAGAAVTAGAADPEAPLLGARQARIFQQACARCHARPGIGVPLIGDEAAWRDRRERGFDALLATTVNGNLLMPPLGTCGACTEDDLRRLVAFVAGYAALPDVAGAAR